jgi:hypothetical protein
MSDAVETKAPLLPPVFGLRTRGLGICTERRKETERDIQHRLTKLEVFTKLCRVARFREPEADAK